MDKYKIVKEKSKELLKPLSHLFLLLIVLGILRPRNPLEFTIVIILYGTLFNMKASPLDTVKAFIGTYIIIWLVYKSFLFGLLGAIAIIIFLGLYRIIRNWTGYMEAIYSVETMLYGKPLKLRGLKWKRNKKNY